MLISLVGWLFVLAVGAQSGVSLEKIALTTTKTVSLVFPTQVLSIDRGSDQVLVQKTSEHIVKVKALIDSFPESNLTVLTADGKLYSFILIYVHAPATLVWYLGDSRSAKTVHPLQQLCDQVKKMKSPLPGIKYSAGKVSLDWMGWFIRDSILFCKLKFTNRSSIGYDIDQFQLYIRDNRISRRTAAQELLQAPIFVSGDSETIKANSSKIWIIALKKFTIPDDKHFAVEVLEKNGGRHLYLRSSNRQLMSAKLL